MQILLWTRNLDFAAKARRLVKQGTTYELIKTYPNRVRSNLMAKSCCVIPRLLIADQWQWNGHEMKHLSLFDVKSVMFTGRTLRSELS